MSDIEIFLNRFLENSDKPALGWKENELSFQWLADEIQSQITSLSSVVNPGDKVILQSDFTPTTIAILFALIHLKAIIAPLLTATLTRSSSLSEIIDPDVWVKVISEKEVTTQRFNPTSTHDLVKTLREKGAPGLILFTSGSTGQPKGVVHDFSRLLHKFHTKRPALRCINFLLFDHWGGLNTLFHNLSNGGFLVLPEQRLPEYICSLVARHQIELLPASPTFLNLLLMSQSYTGKDMSSLKVISYGSEPMFPSTLNKLISAFPGVEFRQTYGLIELGVLRAKSKSSDSLLVKVGGEGFDVRIVNGLLEIKADSAMLGYLNAPSPFTEDGYFMTGDRVELEGEYIRILGRQSDLINVGGQKVYPAEVENILLSCDDVADAIVFGERHPTMGNIVCTKIRLKQPCENEGDMRRRIKTFSSTRLEPFKVPVKITFSLDALHGDRMKRMRHTSS